MIKISFITGKGKQRVMVTNGVNSNSQIQPTSFGASVLRMERRILILINLMYIKQGREP